MPQLMRTASQDVGAAENTVSTKGDVIGASDTLLQAAQARFTTTEATAANINYLNEMSAKLEQDGLLPSVTLSYLKKNFDRLDADGNNTVTEAELKALGQNGKPIFDQKMSAHLLAYMQEIGETTIHEDDLELFRTGAQHGYKVKEAYYHGRVLRNTDSEGKSLLSRIHDQADRDLADDGYVTKKDIQKYIDKHKADPNFAGSDEGKALDWLNKHWDDRAVRVSLKGQDGRIKVADFEANISKLGQGLKLEKPPAAPAAAPGDGKPAEAVKPNVPEAKPWGPDERPLLPGQIKKHDVYYSDGRGNTVSVDLKEVDGKKTNIPQFITLGTANADGTVEYTGWGFNHLLNDGKGLWVKYNKDTPIATADGIELQQDGTVKITGKFTSLVTLPTDPGDS